MSGKMPNTSNEQREQLPAEQKFDKAVYGGISYVAQALAGSGLAYWIKHSGGRPIFDKMANWLGPNFISKISKATGKEAVERADSWITVTTMVGVGTLFLIPVKWLEDRKASIVENWTKKDNEKRAAQGNPVSTEELAKQEQMLDELKADSKQTWRSLLIARGASLIPVYAAVPLIGKHNATMEAGFQKLTKTLASVAGLKKMAKSEAFHNASGIAFYDGFYSIISSGGLYIFSHMISPIFSPSAHKKHPDHHNTEIIAALVEPAHAHPQKTEPDSEISNITQIISNLSTSHNHHTQKPHTSMAEAVMASKNSPNQEARL
jgi:hypothetical protein